MRSTVIFWAVLIFNKPNASKTLNIAESSQILRLTFKDGMILPGSETSSLKNDHLWGPVDALTNKIIIEKESIILR